MIYFFSRDCEYVQCEIHSERPYVLTFILPDGASHSERYTSNAHLTARWQQWIDALQDTGWSGPFGRDLRS